MKMLSEQIADLQKLFDEHGDLQVIGFDSEEGYVEDIGVPEICKKIAGNVIHESDYAHRLRQHEKRDEMMAAYNEIWDLLSHGAQISWGSKEKMIRNLGQSIAFNEDIIAQWDSAQQVVIV